MPRIRSWKDWIPASGEGRALVEVKGRVGGKGSRYSRSPEDDRRGGDVPGFRPQGKRRYRMSRYKGFWDALPFHQLSSGSTATEQQLNYFIYEGGHIPIQFIGPQPLIPQASSTDQPKWSRLGHTGKMQLTRLQGDIWCRLLQNQVNGEEAAPGRFPFMLIEWRKFPKGVFESNLEYLRAGATPAANESAWTKELLSDLSAAAVAANTVSTRSGGIPGHLTADDVMMRRVIHFQPTAALYNADELLPQYIQKAVRIPYPKRPMCVLDVEESCLALSVQLFEYGNGGVAIPYTDSQAGGRYKFEFRNETFRGHWVPS